MKNVKTESLATTELSSVDMLNFEIEELEDRLENCWQGKEWVSSGYYNQYGQYQDTSYQVSC